MSENQDSLSTLTHEERKDLVRTTERDDFKVRWHRYVSSCLSCDVKFNSGDILYESWWNCNGDLFAYYFCQKCYRKLIEDVAKNVELDSKEERKRLKQLDQAKQRQQKREEEKRKKEEQRKQEARKKQNSLARFF